MLDIWFMRFWGLFGKGMHVIDRQVIKVDDPFEDGDRILDLGGGGEGVIGRLRGRQVTAVDIRKGELDDTPEGPTKVIADARDLPFPDGSFDAAAAFFFLMYLRREDRGRVLEEAFRVLKPGGRLHIWDAAIPEARKGGPRLFVVPLTAVLPGRTIRTAYGTGWEGKAMSRDDIADKAAAAGFTVAAREERGETFRLVLSR